MSTQSISISHLHRSRTRSAAFLLAVSVFIATKLIAGGAVNVSRNYNIEGMQMLDVDCTSELHC